MATKKEIVTSGSLGRTSGSLFRQDSGSHESLTQHPLLLSSSPVSHTAPATSETSSTPPKYVPYTPRQRAQISQPTTGTSSQSPVSFIGPQGGATPQLMLQNLKATAQALDLPSGSLGWAICEKLCNDGDKPEYEELWKALVQQKVMIQYMCFPESCF